MGFESICPEALASAQKTRNMGKTYSEVVDILHGHGILVQACFVFGFDSDDTSVFDEAADYIVRAKFDLPQISIYTPFPGTPVFDRLESQGRILTRNWTLYNGQNVVFRPALMTVQELEQGVERVRRRVNSVGALARRLMARPLWVKPLALMSYLGFRFYQYRIARVGAVDAGD
jgi:radical SAM superfamily enzyme YgiQ (UPF0313 family)